ncbi:MAG: DUF1799 domain-containing protein [Betaproteobacteria bacterium]|nr:DUF1799 domain-containing protein [Betaproteobacteria bacterium]
MRNAGMEIDPSDLPPGMAWEAAVWELYERMQTQWRVGFGGRTGLDYNPAIKLIERYGWDLELALDLLGVIEHTILEEDEKKRVERQPSQT